MKRPKENRALTEELLTHNDDASHGRGTAHHAAEYKVGIKTRRLDQGRPRVLAGKPPRVFDIQHTAFNMRGRTRQLDLAWNGRTPAAAQSSYEAALMAECHAETDCAILRRFLLAREAFGATDAEVERALGWPPNVVTARRNNLVERGQVVQPVPYVRARRESVKTKGLKVSVWIASEFAMFW